MLRLAYDYQDQLNKLYRMTALDDKYKFESITSWQHYTLELGDSDWEKIQFVSVNKDDEVIGYLAANIDRDIHSISELHILNFHEVNIIFSRDLREFLDSLFCKYKFNKINFSVAVGNPAEEMYDKYIKKYNGRIVGVKKKHIKLRDGNMYDCKLYEIFRKDYLRKR